MKKVLGLLIALTLTTAVFAQDSTSSVSSMSRPVPKHADHNGVIMKDGKVLVLKNGQVSTLSDNITLDNGTTIMANGTVKMKDGTTSTLQEGDYLKMDGSKGNMNMRMKRPQMAKIKADSTQ